MYVSFEIYVETAKFIMVEDNRLLHPFTKAQLRNFNCFHANSRNDYYDFKMLH